MDLFQKLEIEGYKEMRQVPNRGICGLRRFMFTTGLCYGLSESIYDGRYCYSSWFEASEALVNWDGVGDPKDSDWIKHKGDTEYPNPNKN